METQEFKINVKKTLLFKAVICLTLFAGTVNAQEAPNGEKAEFKPSGKALGKIFFNYHYDMTDGVDKSSVFEIQRSYFGYKYAFSEKLSAKVTFDVGNVGSGSVYTAYLKVAQLDWKVAKAIKLSLGQIGLKQFNDQEHLWGNRYIYKSFMDEHKFGSSADAGFNINIKPHDMIQFNILAINGEGYKSSQDDFGLHKVGGNAVFTPVEGLTIKVYYDMMGKMEQLYRTDGTDSIKEVLPTQSNISTFIGYSKKDKFKIGAEYNMHSNNKNVEDRDLTGISAYATYIINKKFDVFARFDMLQSNTIGTDSLAWNNSKNGNLILGGVEYKPVKGVSMSLNYQGWTYEDTALDPASKPKVYLNFEYKF